MLPLGLTELRFIMSITFFVYSHTRAKFENVDVKTFYQYTGPTYPKLKKRHRRPCQCYQYLCLRTTVIFNDLKQVSMPISIDGCASHLNVTTAIAQSLVPDIDMLATAKRCQVCSSRSSTSK